MLFIEEVFIKIQGKQHYLWRAVAQDGEGVDVFLKNRRDAKAAVSTRLFPRACFHAPVYNLFNPGRHLVSAETYR